MDIWKYIRIKKIDETNVDDIIKRESYTWSGEYGEDLDWEASPKGLTINSMGKYGETKLYKWNELKDIVLRGKQLSWF